MKVRVAEVNVTRACLGEGALLNDGAIICRAELFSHNADDRRFPSPWGPSGCVGTRGGSAQYVLNSSCLPARCSGWHFDAQRHCRCTISISGFSDSAIQQHLKMVDLSPHGLIIDNYNCRRARFSTPDSRSDYTRNLSKRHKNI